MLTPVLSPTEGKEILSTHRATCPAPRPSHNAQGFLLHSWPGGASSVWTPGIPLLNLKETEQSLPFHPLTTQLTFYQEFIWECPSNQTSFKWQKIHFLLWHKPRFCPTCGSLKLDSVAAKRKKQTKNSQNKTKKHPKTLLVANKITALLSSSWYLLSKRCEPFSYHQEGPSLCLKFWKPPACFPRASSRQRSLWASEV